MRQTTPIAVLTADVHYSLQTLQVADAAMKKAVSLANQLNVPLVIAGDLHDTKANIRGECIKAIKSTLMSAKKCVVLTGNHDMINEKSKEHSLEFLKHTGVHVIDRPYFHEDLRLFFIPYQHSPEDFKAVLKQAQNFGHKLVVHQGVSGSDSGHYIQDKSAIPAEWLDDMLVFSGHYHRRQAINCGKTGLFHYIGNPYTLTYGEAKDPAKGVQILYDNGSLKFFPLNLRRHRVYEFQSNNIHNISEEVSSEDPVWVKISGTQADLATLSKPDIAEKLDIPQTFRLDLIPTSIELSESVSQERSQAELLDHVIDSLSGVHSPQKIRLKKLWREL